MKVVPMIFNTEMVRAKLDGRKTATRRPVKRFGVFNWVVENADTGERYATDKDNVSQKWLKFPINIGDLIYVRETFATLGHNDYQEVSPSNKLEIHEIRYKASERESIANEPDWEVRGYHWRPSIHMPRWASRLTLKVIDVRIEQLKDLRKNPEQIKKEGFENWPQFEHVWKSIYGDCSPGFYVWAIEFEVIHQNVDKYLSYI